MLDCSKQATIEDSRICDLLKIHFEIVGSLPGSIRTFQSNLKCFYGIFVVSQWPSWSDPNWHYSTAFQFVIALHFFSPPVHVTTRLGKFAEVDWWITQLVNSCMRFDSVFFISCFLVSVAIHYLFLGWHISLSVRKNYALSQRFICPSCFAFRCRWVSKSGLSSSSKRVHNHSDCKHSPSLNASNDIRDKSARNTHTGKFICSDDRSDHILRDQSKTSIEIDQKIEAVEEGRTTEDDREVEADSDEAKTHDELDDDSGDEPQIVKLHATSGPAPSAHYGGLSTTNLTSGNLEALLEETKVIEWDEEKSSECSKSEIIFWCSIWNFAVHQLWSTLMP